MSINLESIICLTVFIVGNPHPYINKYVRRYGKTPDKYTKKGKTGKDKTRRRQDKLRQVKTSQDKTRQDRTGQERKG